MSITLTPLSGPFPSPPSYLLTIDSAKILLDCGIQDSLSEFPSRPSTSELSSPTTSTTATADYLRRLRTLAPKLNLVVLSHPLLTSIGLLPWLKAKCGLRCPVYASLPTREMGRYAVEEWIDARSQEQENLSRTKKKKNTTQVPGTETAKGKKVKTVKLEDEVMAVVAETIDEPETDEELIESTWRLSTKEIRDAFLSVIAVRWTQPVHLSGPLKGYTLVAHRSGHTLGGSIFTLRPSLSSSLSPASSASSMLYAPIFNHVKERHVDGAALLNGARIDEGMRRMGVVVVGAERAEVTNAKRVDKERKLLDLITNTMKSGGSLLLPVDASARVLELLVLLESHWAFNNLGQQHPLVLISRTGKDVITFVRSLTEWMGSQIGKEAGGERLLRFSNVLIYQSIEAMDADIPTDVPKTILVTPSTLSHGYSRELFVDFAKVESNIVLLTQRSESGSLGRWLFDLWNDGQAEEGKWGKGKTGEVIKLNQEVDLQMKRKVYLEGEELEAQLEAEREETERLARHQAVLDRSRRMMNADGDSDSDSDLEDEDELEAEDVKPDQVGRRRTGGFAGGAGAWDEFLDESNLTGRAGAFDIYVKGEYGVRRVMDGLPRFRMFPAIERKRRVDAYGEAIDVEGWLKRGIDEDPLTGGLASGAAMKKLGQAAAALGVGGAKRARMDDDDEAEIEPEKPHKYVVETITTQLSCSLFVVDMEGASDGRALKTILPQINPRKLVIVNGSPSAISALAEHCRSVNAMSEELFTPSPNEQIIVGEETKNFSIRLGDSIMSSLRLSRVEDYDVAYISGVIHLDAESDWPTLERSSLTDAIPLVAAIEAPRSGDEDQRMADDETTTLVRTLPPLQPSLFIGDLRLTLLKERLAARGIPSEFAGEGILVCGPAPPSTFDPKGELQVDIAGGRVAVKKSARGRVLIEGTPGETYQVVRSIVYELHAPAG